MAFNKVTHSQIRDNWKTILQQVTQDNGYNNDLSADSLFDGARDPTQGNYGDKHLDAYPLVSIDLEAERYNYGISGQVVKDSIWIIGIAVVADPDDSSASSLIDAQQNIVDDIENVILNNSTLGGIARMTRILELYADTGLQSYEGIVLFRVLVQYETRANV